MDDPLHIGAQLNRWLALLLATVIGSLPAPAVAGFWDTPTPTALLTADEAFELYPVELSDRRLRLEWRIAPDYYLYQHSLTAITDQPQVTIGDPELPEGQSYHDEYFGDVEIYRDRLVIWIPVQQGQPTTITVRYQGCADAGVCYPPQTRTMKVDTL